MKGVCQNKRQEFALLVVFTFLSLLTNQISLPQIPLGNPEPTCYHNILWGPLRSTFLVCASGLVGFLPLMINLKPPLKLQPAGFQKLNVCNHQNGQKIIGLGDFLGSESFFGNSYPALFLKKINAK